MKTGPCIVLALLLFCGAVDAGAAVIAGARTVSEDIVVKEGETLRVMPGATLLFMPGVGVRVEGTLDCSGSAGRPVALAQAGTGRWAGIRANSSATVKLTGTAISGADEAVRVAGGRLVIRKSKISGCEKGITLETMAEADIQELDASNIKKVCLSVRQGSKAEVRKSWFKGQGDTGVSITGKGGLKVASSSFSGLDAGLRATYPGASPEITGCSFKNCGSGLFAEYPEAAPKVRDCIFDGNKNGIYAKRLAAPEVAGCEITGNEYGVYAMEGASTVVKDSRITGNRYGVYAHMCSYPTVNSSDLSGNKEYAVYLDEQSYEWVLKTGGESERKRQMGMRARAGQGGADNRRRGQEIDRYVNPKGPYVDMRNNFWGAGVTGEMQKSGELREISGIYDYFDKNTDIYDGKVWTRDIADYSGYLAASPIIKNKNRTRRLK